MVKKGSFYQFFIVFFIVPYQFYHFKGHYLYRSYRGLKIWLSITVQNDTGHFPSSAGVCWTGGPKGLSLGATCKLDPSYNWFCETKIRIKIFKYLLHRWFLLSLKLLILRMSKMWPVSIILYGLRHLLDRETTCF